jgi:general stress protein YciG
MVAEKLKLLCKAKSAMAVYLDYRQAQNKTVLLTHESTRKKPSKYTNRDLKHEKGDELERERGSVCVCVCVCVCEREREREREGGREGGETSTHHSVTKLGGISELMDGERKPNVKF